MANRSNFQQAGRTNNQYNNDKVPYSEGSTPKEDFDKMPVDNADDAKSNTKDNQDWLARARDAFRASEDYFDSSIRKTMEKNLAHFQGRHAPGSKYYSDTYKYRAKGFRPKTRSVIRKNESQAAVALFSTADVVTVMAENDVDPRQVVSAEINQQILNYRLSNTIPWYKVAMGAYQDALTQGVVISHQNWDFQEATELELVTDDDGKSVLDEETGRSATGKKRTVIKDTPRIEIRPVENVRFSPSADWDDPLGTSPYIVDILPMEIGEVKLRAKQTNKTKIPWKDLSDKELHAGLTESYDPIRSQRESNRQDSKDQTHEFTDYDTVWVHRNIVKVEGIDYIYYTLGVHYMLSDPIALKEEYPWLRAGERPYVMGVAILETHKVYPDSLAQIGSGLQQEANDINNQRRDNVQLVLNRRYYARRGAQIDMRSLTRNVPGSVTEMNDINNDIRSEAPPEVTGSAYQEQDRINLDFDELTGSFSTSSVGSNRQLNETVGGMELLSGGADSISEYQLRTFVETWVEPVLKQIIQLEQYFETDEGLLGMIGKKLDMWNRYNVSRVTDMMIQGSMNIQVNVGFGATDPKQRIEKLVTGISSVLQFSPEMNMRLAPDELAKEIFGALGYAGADRFFPPVDPENPPQPPEDPNITTEKMRADTNMQLGQMKAQTEQAKLENAKMLQQMKDEFGKWKEVVDNESKEKVALKELERDLLHHGSSEADNMQKIEAAATADDKKIKADLAKAALTERGTNERFVAEKKFAETTGEGRGL
jgi:hypothetical protein